VEHLYALGHRRLAFVGGPLSTSNGARRRASFDEAALPPVGRPCCLTTSTSVRRHPANGCGPCLRRRSGWSARARSIPVWPVSIR